ncbi:sigma factor-like helix-turn-helix DNA-binding protein [Sorangium sp. So ce1151]
MLDVAEQGGVTVQEVAAVLGMSLDEVRRIEREALARLKTTAL